MHQHGAAEHRLRRHQAARRLDDDAAGDDEQHQTVAEGDQHLQPLEAIGALAVRRPAREAEGEPGEKQAGEIGEHVAGIGQQRQRAGDEAAGRLDHHERAGDERCPEHAALVVAVAVALSDRGCGRAPSAPLRPVSAGLSVLALNIAREDRPVAAAG